MRPRGYGPREHSRLLHPAIIYIKPIRGKLLNLTIFIKKMKKPKLINIMRYESFIIVGVIMIIGTLLKLIGLVNFSSDWFWFLAGLGFVVEGTISLVKQKRFEKKYKIIERQQYKN